MPVLFDSGRYLFIVTSMLASLTLPVKGGAAEWTAEPAVKMRREYNDNFRLSIFPQKSVNGSIITPALDLGVAGPVWNIGFGAEATQRRYSGQEGLDRDDSLLKLSSLYKTERSTWQLNASRARDSAVTSEQVDADTGTVQTLKDRETDTVTPSWIWMYSQRTKLQLAYQQTEVAYDENSLGAGLYDYRYRTVSATLANQLSERNQVFMSAGYSEYHVPITGFDSETRNVQAGITRNFTESTKGTLQAGQRRTESFTKGGTPTYTYFSTASGIFRIQTGVTQDTRTQSTGSVFSGNLEKKSESTDWNFLLSRALNPSGSGGQVEQDTFGLKLNNRLSPRIGMHVDGGALKVRTEEGNISNSERTFYDLGVGVFWQWRREWGVGTNYRYAHVKRVYENEAADSNSVNLTLIYRPLKMSISR